MPFQQGNSKLGRKIWAFSIPAGSTCPGKTDSCSNECYAAKGFFLMPNVKRSLQANYAETQQPNFVSKSIAHLKKVKAKVCRVHVSGDLYDKAYAQKWLKIFKAIPDCRFFIYTRSWRIKDIKPVVVKMARLPNVKMWYSVDAETGQPKRVPKTVRLAYMQTSHEDVPAYPTHLIFRVDRLLDRVAKKVNGVQVCPVENGVTQKLTCVKCGICWKDRDEVFDWSSSPALKYELPMV